MGEAVGHHGAARRALQGVVADLLRGVHGGLDVARVEPLLRLLRVVRPHAREAVGLQLDAHADGVVLRLAQAPAHAVDLGGDAQFVLHMVTDLVRDDVRLRELARCAELVLQGVVERQVDVDLLVARAVERPHGRLAGAAGRGRGTAEQHEPGRLVAAAALAEEIGPDHLGVLQHGGDEGRLAVAGGWLGRGALLLLLHLDRVAAAAEQAQHGERIDAEDPARDERDRDGADADAAPAKQAATTTAAAPTITAVFDVVGLFVAFPSHRSLLAGLLNGVFAGTSQDGTWPGRPERNRRSGCLYQAVRSWAA
ncbi:hypothetical protein D3C72_1319830 [compost metagenome]